MNKGAIGRINQNKEIIIPDYLLTTLGVNTGNVLFGRYYPKSEKKIDFNNKKGPDKMDFMLTPIPNQFWYCAASLIIRIRQQSIAIEAISNVLEKNEVNILYSEAGKNAHRYSTWRIHIAFDKLPYEPLCYIEDESVYGPVMDKLKKLISDIKNECSEFLFSDMTDDYLRDAILFSPNRALHFFYWISYNKTEVIEKPFQLTYNGKFISDRNSELSQILNKIKTGRNEIYPSLLYSEIDTHYFNIRLQILPRKRARRFIHFKIIYAGETKLNKGLIHWITKQMATVYKVWNFHTECYFSSESYQSGDITYILEVEPEYEVRQIENLIVQLKDRSNTQFEKLDLNFNYFLYNDIPDIKQIDSFSGFNSENNNKETVFICYHSSNLSIANDIKEKFKNVGVGCYVHDYSKSLGSNFYDQIRDALIHCQEFCLIWTGANTKESEWVNTEWGGAWVLGKKISVIKFGGEMKDIPSRLLQYDIITPDSVSINKYVTDVRSRINPLSWGASPPSPFYNNKSTFENHSSYTCPTCRRLF